MDSEWLQQRLMILRAADTLREMANRGTAIPDDERNIVDEVAGRIWTQIHEELGTGEQEGEQSWPTPT